MSNSTYIRLEVTVNGRILATAGIHEPGVLDATISWVYRRETEAPDHIKSNPTFNMQEWVDGSIILLLGGLNSDQDQHLEWIDEELHVGDEVTIKVLPPGPYDAPINTTTRICHRPE